MMDGKAANPDPAVRRLRDPCARRSTGHQPYRQPPHVFASVATSETKSSSSSAATFQDQLLLTTRKQANHVRTSRHAAAPPLHRSLPANEKKKHTGGKAKPLKAPKKEKKDLDEADLEFKERQKKGIPPLPRGGFSVTRLTRAEAAERKALAEQAKKKGPMV
jgi:hypothetical protein